MLLTTFSRLSAERSADSGAASPLRQVLTSTLERSSPEGLEPLSLCIAWHQNCDSPGAPGSLHDSAGLPRHLPSRCGSSVGLAGFGLREPRREQGCTG